MTLIESYNKLIGTLNHHTPVFYTKQVRAAVEILDKEHVAKIAEDACRSALLSAKPSEQTPSVEIILGYPGAGKTTVENKIRQNYHENIINADFDNFRKFDSRLFNTIQTNPLTADFFSQVPAEIRKELLRQTAKEKKNVLISAPYLSLFEQNKYSIFSTFSPNDYNINITYIAANQHLCCLSNFTRYFSALFNNLKSREDFIIPRLLSPKQHQILSNHTKENIREISENFNKNRNFNFEIVDREGKSLWKNGASHQITPVIKRRENTPLNFGEIKRLQYEMEYINMVVNSIGIGSKEAHMLETFLKGYIQNLSLAQDKRFYAYFNQNRKNGNGI